MRTRSNAEVTQARLEWLKGAAKSARSSMRHEARMYRRGHGVFHLEEAKFLRDWGRNLERSARNIENQVLSAAG